MNRWKFNFARKGKLESVIIVAPTAADALVLFDVNIRKSENKGDRYACDIHSLSWVPEPVASPELIEGKPSF
jgi:hypothetical protein